MRTKTPMILACLAFVSVIPALEQASCADALKRVYGMVDVEALTVNRYQLGRQKSRSTLPLVSTDSMSAMAESLDEMPIAASVSTIEGGAFSGVYVDSHINIEPIEHPSPGSRPGAGVQVDLDVVSLMFPKGLMEDRSVVRAAAMFEFERSYSSSWSFEFILGGRLAPNGWHSPGHYALTGDTSVSLVLERFVSGTSDGGPERWEMVREYELGNDCGEPRFGVHVAALERGRYRMWVEFERTEVIRPNDPVRQVSDGIHLRVFFDNII